MQLIERLLGSLCVLPIWRKLQIGVKLHCRLVVLLQSLRRFPQHEVAIWIIGLRPNSVLRPEIRAHIISALAIVLCDIQVLIHTLRVRLDFDNLPAPLSFASLVFQSRLVFIVVVRILRGRLSWISTRITGNIVTT